MKKGLLSSFLFCLAVACGGTVESPPGPSTPSGPAAGTGSSPTQPPIASTPTKPSTPSTGTSSGTSVAWKWSQTGRGCGDVTVALADTQGIRFLVVHAKRAALGLASKGDSATIDLGADVDGPDVNATLLVYPTKTENPAFCTDYGSPNDPQPTNWTLRAGTVTITLETPPPSQQGEGYKVTASFTGVVARAPDGTLHTLPNATVSNVAVGWLAG